MDKECQQQHKIIFLSPQELNAVTKYNLWEESEERIHLLFESISNTNTSTESRNSMVESANEIISFTDIRNSDRLKLLKKWFYNNENSKYIQSILDLSRNLILDSENSISKLGFQLLSQIYVINSKTSLNFFNHLLEEANQKQANNEITVLEMYESFVIQLWLLFNIKELATYQATNDFFKEFYVFANRILENTSQEYEQMQTTVFGIFRKMINDWSKLFDDDELYTLFNYSITKTGNTNIYLTQAALGLADTIFCLKYDTSEKLLEQCINKVYTMVDPSQPSYDIKNKEPINVGLDFLRALSIAEKIKTENDWNIDNLLKKPHPLTPYATKFFPACLNALQKLDPNDKDIEDTSVKTPSIYASVSLNYLFKMTASEELLHLIEDNAIKLAADHKNWCNVHASAMLFYALSPRDVTLPAVIKKEVIDFLRRNIPTLIKMCEHPVIRVRESSLYVLSWIINNQPAIISEASSPATFIHQILGLFYPQEGITPKYPLDIKTPQLILVRIGSLISAIIKVFPYSRSTSTNFETVPTMLYKIIDRPEFDKVSTSTACHIFVALENYFSVLSHSPNQVLKYLQECLERLQKSHNRPQNIIMGHVNLLVALLPNFIIQKMDIHRKCVGEILGILNEGEYPTIEIWQAVAHLMITPGLYTPVRIDSVIGPMRHSLTGDDENSLSGALVCLHSVIVKNSAAVRDGFVECGDIVSDLIRANGLPLKCRPMAVKALSSILNTPECAAGKGGSELLERRWPWISVLSEAVKSLRDDCLAYRRAINGDKFDLKNVSEKGLMFVAECYSAAAMGLRVMARYVMKEEETVKQKRALLLEVAKLSERLSRLPKLSALAYKDFLDLLGDIRDLCPRQLMGALCCKTNLEAIRIARDVSEISNLADTISRRLSPFWRKSPTKDPAELRNEGLDIIRGLRAAVADDNRMKMTQKKHVKSFNKSWSKQKRH